MSSLSLYSTSCNAMPKSIMFSSMLKRLKNENQMDSIYKKIIKIQGLLLIFILYFKCFSVDAKNFRNETFVYPSKGVAELETSFFFYLNPNPVKIYNRSHIDEKELYFSFTPFFNYFIVNKFYLGGGIDFGYSQWNYFYDIDIYTTDIQKNKHFNISPGLKFGLVLPINKYLFFDISVGSFFNFNLFYYTNPIFREIIFLTDSSISISGAFKFKVYNGLLSLGVKYYYYIKHKKGTEITEINRRNNMKLINIGYSFLF